MAQGKNIPYGEIIERRNCGSSRVQCSNCGKIKRIKNMALYKEKILCSNCKPNIIAVGEKSITKTETEFLSESNKIEREYSEEALRCAKEAWKYAKQNRGEFSVEYILEIHKKLMRILNTRIAGKIRECAVYIGGETRDQKAQQIKVELEAWLEHQFTRKTVRGIIQSHIVFERIHPFEDGNGRVGRILMNIQRINARLPILVIHEGWEQQKYYEWFQENK